MGNLLMILSFLMPTLDQTETKKVEPTSTRIYRAVALGMTKTQVFDALGTPSSISKGSNLISEPVTMLYFNGDMCSFSMHSCSVRLADGRVDQIFDLKSDLDASI